MFFVGKEISSFLCTLFFLINTILVVSTQKKKKKETKKCGIYFTFVPPCGPFVPSLLEVFCLMVFNSVAKSNCTVENNERT